MPGGWSPRRPPRPCASIPSVSPCRRSVWRELEVGATPRRVHPPDRHPERVTQPQLAAGSLPEERGPQLIQLPPVTAHPAHGQEALEPLLPEAHECALRDEPDDLAVEPRLPALVVEAALE